MSTTSVPTNWRERPVLTIREYAALVGCAPQTVYSAVNRGEVPTIKVGNRHRIPVVVVRRLLGEVPELGGAA